MSFCQTCQSLPFPDMFKLWKVDRSIYDTFEWFQSSKSVRSKDPFVRWHPNISQLQRGSENCSLCLAIWDRMKNSYHYHVNCRDQDERPLWLELKVGYPLWILYIGKGEPEERLSGNYTIRMTPDQAVQDTNPFFVEVIEDSLHPLVLGKARNWIQTCNEQHPDCFHELNTETKLPTRLLDLGSLPSGNEFDCIQGDPRTLLEDTSFNLVETSPGEKGQYIALSYCWGQGLAYKTMTDNLQKHKSNGGIRYAQLPKTLQDAVFLTRYLGIRYIWADCLCIIQDDKADWEYEASRMADVYTNGYLTIAAARASHCNEGFLNPRKSKDRDIVPLPTEKGPCNLYFYYDDLIMSPGSIDSVVAPAMSIRKEEPLLSRVWCAQERVLANRTLHMGSQQMYWECSRHFQTEDGMTDDIEFCPQYNLSQIADGLKNVVDISKVKSTRPIYNSNEERWALNKEWRPWLRLIEEYTSRNMTVASDKLPALSGVMSALQKLTGDTCLAGIWKSWFTRGLLWRIQVPEWDNYVFHPKIASRPDFWRAPSWSFAALEGVVRYHLLQYDYYEEACAELLDCSVVPKGKNPLGELASGFAVIKGPVAQLFDAAEQQSSDGRECRMRMSGNRIAEARVYYDVEYHGACDVLMITPHAGIAIIPDKVDSSKYVRVGAVSVYRVLDPSVENYHNPDSITTIPLSSFTAADWPEPTVITLV